MTGTWLGLLALLERRDPGPSPAAVDVAHGTTLTPATTP